VKSYLYEIRGVVSHGGNVDPATTIDERLLSPIRNACRVLDAFIFRNPELSFQADTKLINEGVRESDFVKWYERDGVDWLTVNLIQIRYTAVSNPLKDRLSKVIP